MIYLELTGSLTPAQFMTGAGGSKIGDVGTPIFKQFLLTLQMILFSARFLQLFNITTTNFLFLNCIIHILQAHMFFQYANETKTLPIPNLLDLKNYNRHSMTSLGEAMITGSKSSSIASIFFEKSKKKKNQNSTRSNPFAFWNFTPTHNIFHCRICFLICISPYPNCSYKWINIEGNHTETSRQKQRSKI